MSLLVVMGSGETAPAMVKVHRAVLEASGPGPAVMLDTPFGFQENADELTARTQAYFARSIGRAVDVARWRSAEQDVVERERALARLAEARWVFAGPGSPTYALRQWRDTPLVGALGDVLGRGGTIVMGSAAAVTLGSHALPVYEIYKVGAEPAWVPGLDLLGRAAGLPAAVIPHYDNAEGATHDTRYCYLGERRLRRLEEALPPAVGVLGVDEHTALVLDLAAGTAAVSGSGGVTLRRRGASTVLAAGAEAPLAYLRAVLSSRQPGTHPTSGPTGAGLAAGAPAGGPAAAVRPPARPGSAQPAERDATGAHGQPSLRAETTEARRRFDAALAASDVPGAVGAVLALEDAITSWSADTLQSDEADRARRELRAMVVRLGELAEVGARDPAQALAPYVRLALDLRRRAREARDFATSDLVRARLEEAGVEVRDTRDGVTWALRSTSGPD